VRFVVALLRRLAYGVIGPVLTAVMITRSTTTPFGVALSPSARTLAVAEHPRRETTAHGASIVTSAGGEASSDR